MTNEEKAVVRIALAILETIRELGEVPNGVLYAHLQGRLSFDTYMSIIAMLKKSGRVKEENHVLSVVSDA